MFLGEYFLTKTTLNLFCILSVQKVLFKFLTMHYLYETKKCFINVSNGQKVAEESTSRWEYRTSGTSNDCFRRRVESLKTFFQFFRTFGTSDACVRKQTESLKDYLNSFERLIMEFFVHPKVDREFEKLFQLFRTSGKDVLRPI